MASGEFSRITRERGKLSGKPCIRGLRIPVGIIAGLARSELPDEEILEYYPDLEPEDIAQAVAYAAKHPWVLRR